MPPGAGPPARPKSPRWLWIVAGAAVLLVLALVIALVIANGSAKNQTVVAPLPAMPRSSTPASKSASSTTAAPSSSTTSPTSTSGATTSAAAAQTVVYSVTGQGHAISITYIDDGGVRQTEFNVVLPWTKQVSLSTQDTASVTIVNLGHDITCSVTVGGAQVQQRTGVGFTVCNAAG
jgi:cytoskeletal protein RodZ